MEIGVGGYDNPEWGGNSLRMWKRFFPHGRIFSMDIYDKSPHEEARIRIFKGSQIDIEFLDHVCNQVGDFDIIIDDGSHINEHVILTFEHLFPKLKAGGIYVVEDTQTSYWDSYGGSMDLITGQSLMNYFKKLADSLNSVEFIQPGYRRSYFDETIVSIHFYHNLIFIYKGINNEKSNLIVDNSEVTK